MKLFIIQIISIIMQVDGKYTIIFTFKVIFSKNIHYKKLLYLQEYGYNALKERHFGQLKQIFLAMMNVKPIIPG